jgi:hypothetical protein
MMKFAFSFILVSLAKASMEENTSHVCTDSAAAAAATADEASRSAEQDALTAQLVDWLRDNGAYINEKLSIKQLDPSLPRGIYAMNNMEEGETVCKIPWSLILKPSAEELAKEYDNSTDCGTIESVYHAITVERDEMTPYGRYLLNQPKAYTAAFLSQVSVKSSPKPEHYDTPICCCLNIFHSFPLNRLLET